MRIVGTSDIHAPVFLKELKKASEECGNADLLILAGDIIDRGRIEYYGEVVDELSKTGAKMIAVFGNDEFDDLKEELRRTVPKVRFLDDESLIVTINGVNLGIVGSRGSLELPTIWQRRRVPDIERIYEGRIKVLGEMLRDLRKKADLILLITHYATTTKTLRGENPRAWRYLGHRGFEDYFRDGLVDIAVHGHSHNGSKFATIGRTIVYNVAFPLWKKLVDVSPKRRVAIGEYLGD